MSIRSLSFPIAIVTLVLFANALPKPAVTQTPTVVLAPQEFGIVEHKPDFKHGEMTYCNNLFVFEPATKYSPNNEYLRFYYLSDHKTIAYDEALLRNLTVVTDDTVSAPKARLVRSEGSENIWEIIVTAKMKEMYSSCLGKIKTQ
jgi:hypothetical protein